MSAIQRVRLAGYLCAAVAGLMNGQAAATTYSKTEVITYQDNTSKWVLGQTASLTCLVSVPASEACDGDVVSATTFDSTYALPVTFSSFGKLAGTYGFDTTSTVASGQLGTFKTATDGNTHTTTFTSWVRGIPTLVQHADATSDSAVVDTSTGLITSTTDENGFTTGYTYDAMGRVASIVYPTGPLDSWNTTTRSFVAVAATEYGLPAGHWRQTTTTGNGTEITYYDALWRPVLVRQYDSANVAGTQSFVKSAYDSAGHETFASYPSTSSTPTTGVWTTYDALGRVSATSQDSELGLLTTTVAFGSPFTTTVTNPRSKATTTSYLTFDRPSSDAPVSITAPEGVSTTISRDPHGKPLAILRSGFYNGGWLGQTRSYVYDVNQLLCQTINPEFGTTIRAYDGAGNIAWSAEGQTASGLTAASCATDRTNTAASAKTVRTIDAMNRVTLLTTPSNDANITTTYEPDGLVKSLTALSAYTGAPVVTDYRYNRRRLLVAEDSSQPSWYLTTIGYSYDANGHAASLTYPNLQQVTYAPDALGRPTQVGTYATGIGYYPNGAISGFTYGNGLVRTMAQNARGLPATSLDKKPDNSVIAISDTLTYDANGNVLGIADGVPGGVTSRTMAYDDLDRLTSASAPGQWGAATFTYDPIDNLRSMDIGGVGARQYRYNYYGNNVLANITTPAGATVFTFTYGARGNLYSKNSQIYDFDSGNRLTSVLGKENYEYDGLGRRVYAADTVATVWQYAQDGRELWNLDARRQQNRINIYLGNTVLATRTMDWGTGAITVRYLHTDALGSPVAETDATGALTKRNSYEPFGAQYGVPNIDGIGYTGHVMDLATGLTYMQQRYYDPQVGRFLSIDPVGASSANGANFGRYLYANNNPLFFSDPDGRLPGPSLDFWIGVGKAVVDAASVFATSGRAPQYAGPQPVASPMMIFGGGTNPIQQGGYKFGSAAITAEGARGLGTTAGKLAPVGLSDSAVVVRGGSSAPNGANSIEGLATGTQQNEQGPIGFSAQSANGKNACQLCAIYGGEKGYKQVGITTARDIRRAGGEPVQTPTSGNPDHVTVIGLSPQAAATLLESRPNPAYSGGGGR